jgi:hypothetical protein
MSKRAGTLLPASCNACVDVDTQPARDVLRAIENAADQNSHQPPAKRQRCIVAPCGDGAPPAPGALFREARRLLRSPPAGPGASGTPLGREQQAEKISTALKTFLDSGAGGALYVSGLPGTGAPTAAQPTPTRSPCKCTCAPTRKRTHVHAQLLVLL